MQIEDINAVCSKFRERLVQLLFQNFGRMGAGFVDFVCICIVRIPFRCTREATSFPVRLSSESFLLATNVDAGGVYFVVAPGLEVSRISLYVSKKVMRAPVDGSGPLGKSVS